jgi:hypothetical protein|tara:strand:+ start:371 stop:676 length:306 start_codon:yes stop_codon:yes gene_type:complete
MARTKQTTRKSPKTKWPLPYFLAEDGRLWKQIAAGNYIMAFDKEYDNVMEQWWYHGEKDREANENLIKTLGHSHIDKYLASHIASFTYTKPPESLLQIYYD